MLVFVSRLILILIVLLVSPFIVVLALFLLLLNLMYFFRRSPGHRRRNAGEPRAVREKAPKVLIIQSAEPDCLLKALDRMKNIPLISGGRCTVFCRDRSEILRHLAGHPMLHSILPHMETRGWWKHLDDFRKGHFDAVVVFFTGDPSYWKIKYFSLLIGARRKLILNENHRLVSSCGSLFALFERDLILSGIFQSVSWKMRPGLRWLAERYQLLRERSRSSNGCGISRWAVSLAGFQADVPEIKTAAADVAPKDRQTDAQEALDNARLMLTGLAKISLRSFLSSQARFRLPADGVPAVSVILVLFNRAELTFQCLRSLAETGYESMEVIIVDNKSFDDTPFLLDRLEGATILRNPSNLHFIKAANAGASKARGRHILFLNNDAQVMPGAIRAAVHTLESSDDIGAVGGKLILPDGTLQEAGNIVWRDGSCLGYGRGSDPLLPEYMFRRDVDYCSGAFLLTRRETFVSLGGFDEAYQPFYYEETDYCLRLWERGLRVVYEPDAAVLHYEFASSSSSQEAQEWHARNQGVFLRRHRDLLLNHREPDAQNVLQARCVFGNRLKALFIDDRAPHRALGSGFPRSNTILCGLVKSGCFVTYYPTAVLDEDWHDVYADIPREVEVAQGRGPSGLFQFLTERRGYYDLIFISRPHNMQFVRPILQAHPDWFRNTRIIYDAEALFAFRELANLKLRGEEPAAKSIEQLTKSEVELAAEADLVISVSESEAGEFARHGIRNVRVLGHALPVAPTPRLFQEREGFLFVGSILEENSPNGDAILWFVKEILPIIQDKLGGVPFTIAGINRIDIPAGLCHPKILGRVEDLSPIYDKARVFVAPTRFAAGIPHKIHEAAAYGLPVIATSLLMRQLGWSDGEHLLVADKAQLFAEQCIRLHSDAGLWDRVRRAALQRVSIDCSPETFEIALKAILEGHENPVAAASQNLRQVSSGGAGGFGVASPTKGPDRNR